MKIPRIFRNNKFDALLLLICLVAVYLMTASSSDPLAPWIAATPFAAVFLQFQTGNEIIFNLAAGAISAVVMFYLLVRVPAYEKKLRIRAHLLDVYLYYKKQVIYVFLGIIHGSIDTDLADELMNTQKFREYFKAPSEASGQDRRHYIMNNIEEHHLKQLKLESEVLHNELQHAVTTLDIQDTELYTFTRRISESLFRSKSWEIDYDGVEHVLGFYWQLFAGWSFVSGYHDTDQLEEKIRRL